MRESLAGAGFKSTGIEAVRRDHKLHRAADEYVHIAEAREERDLSAFAPDLQIRPILSDESCPEVQ